jgi:von Willebrand factor type A domain/HEAT repeats
MRSRVILLLALLLSVAPALGGEELRKTVAEFKRNFVPGMNSYTREQALEDLAAVHDPKAQKTFQWAFEKTGAEIRRLIQQKDEADEEVSRLEKVLDDKIMRETERARRKGRDPGAVSIPNTLLAQISAARQEVERLQKSVDAEHKIRVALATNTGAWIEGLSEEDRAEVLEDLEEGALTDKDFTVRIYWVEALAATSLSSASRLLHLRLTAEKDRRVLPAVIDGLADQAGDRAVEDLARLRHDARWQIRATAIAALGRIGSPQAIPLLIDWFETEDGRLRGDLGDALELLTGKDFGANEIRWREWWDTNGATFVPPRDRDQPGNEAPEEDPGDGTAPLPPDDDPAPPPPPAGEDHPSFYGIDILSKRILFVIDISNSMNQPVSAGNAERTKVDVAKYELKNAILGLPEDAAFNIIFYHHEVFQWRKGIVAAKGKDRRAGVQFVEDMIADGNTNIHDALELAFHIVGMGARDKNYEIGADTIFFLSDGIPNRGKITDPVMILEEVKRWNQLRRVKIHAVGVGSDHQAAFMKALADASGGTYVSR